MTEEDEARREGKYNILEEGFSGVFNSVEPNVAVRTIIPICSY